MAPSQIVHVAGRRMAALLVALAFVCGFAGCGGAASGTATMTPASAPGTLSVVSASVTVSQLAGVIQIAVSRSGGSAGIVSVAYATVDGTGVAGVDYTKISGTFTWGDGDSSSKTVNVPLSTSPGFGGSRTFAFTLSAATGGASIVTAQQSITITGSGSPGTLSLTSSTATVAQGGGSIALSVTRTGGSTGAVTLAYATADGTAVVGTDYARTTGSLSWADGDTSAKTITIPISATTSYAGTRSFSITLSSPTGGAALGTSTETVSITGSGAPGAIALQSTTATVAQASASVAITFTRTGGSGGAATATYTTSDGTALAGTDYTKTTGTVSWAAGDSASKTVSVPVVAAPFFSGNKSFTVSITGSTGGVSLGTSAETVTITGTLLPPANYFTFSGPTYQWKLTLPIDQYGGTGGTNNIQYAAIEESYAQITAGYASQYFYADTATYGGATNHVIFATPSNGASTTPGSGSDHTRSELRELYSGTGADSNHDWNSSIGGTLTANCIVQAVSVDSDEATIGQIHNQSYVFVLLLYRPAQKDIAFDIYSSYGSSSHTRTSMVTNVNPGDPIAYRIAYQGSNIVVTVNGTTKTFAVDSSWAGTPMYFKLGAYHAAPNIGNPAGDQTQVAFSSFAISH